MNARQQKELSRWLGAEARKYRRIAKDTREAPGFNSQDPSDSSLVWQYKAYADAYANVLRTIKFLENK